MGLPRRYRRPLLGIAAAGVALLLLRLFLFWSHLHAPLTLDNAYFLQVSSGSSLTSVVRSLEREDILQHGDDLLLYARAAKLGAGMKAGEYELAAGLTARGLLELLASGRVVYHQVRIVEGWTLRQALLQIQSHPAVTVTLDPTDAEVLGSLFDSEQYPEGLIFPDTYNFTRGTSDAELLQRARALQQQILDTHWQGRDVGLPYDSPYQALIMASIIEKETALAAEQPQIAGVFIRRLQRNMRLQTDPTVIYGLGETFDGNLTRAQLRSDTPWNTYTRRGLPPTPIALPGLGAIQASLHPDQSDNIYFVARGDGSHYFSATLEEHNRAVRQFQLGEQVLPEAEEGGQAL